MAAVKSESKAGMGRERAFSRWRAILVWAGAVVPPLLVSVCCAAPARALGAPKTHAWCTSQQLSKSLSQVSHRQPADQGWTGFVVYRNVSGTCYLPGSTIVIRAEARINGDVTKYLTPRAAPVALGPKVLLRAGASISIPAWVTVVPGPLTTLPTGCRSYLIVGFGVGGPFRDWRLSSFSVHFMLRACQGERVVAGSGLIGQSVV